MARSDANRVRSATELSSEALLLLEPLEAFLDDAGLGLGPIRALQEWMGHRDLKTTLIYADYAPSEHEAAWVEQAFKSVSSPLLAPTPGTRD